MNVQIRINVYEALVFMPAASIDVALMHNANRSYIVAYALVHPATSEIPTLNVRQVRKLSIAAVL